MATKDTTRRRNKLVFVGESNVGKTSIITKSTVDPNHNPTIGMDFSHKSVRVKDQKLRLQLWDTAGQERFRSLLPAYIRDAQIAIVVFDLTSRATFNECPGWIKDVRKELDDIVIKLVGNKSDLTDLRQVTPLEGLAMAQEHGIEYIETSATEGLNINELFKRIALNIIESGISGQAAEGLQLDRVSNDNKVSGTGKTMCKC